VRDAAGALEWPRQAPEPEAHSDSHREKHAGKIDPSRGRADAGGTRAGGRDDPHAPGGLLMAAIGFSALQPAGFFTTA